MPANVKLEPSRLRLKLEASRQGFIATLSQRDEDGRLVGMPDKFRVTDKEEAKKKARAMARSLGLKSYGVVDKTAAPNPVAAEPG